MFILNIFQECNNNLTEWVKTLFILSSSSFMMIFVNMFTITTKVKVQKSKHVIRCMYNYDKVSDWLYLYKPKNKICIPVFNNLKLKWLIIQRTKNDTQLTNTTRQLSCQEKQRHFIYSLTQLFPIAIIPVLSWRSLLFWPYLSLYKYCASHNIN